MNVTRVLAMARKVLRSLRHDKRTVGFLIFMPIFMIAIFGYTFGGEVKDVDVCIVNMDQGSANGSFAEKIIEQLQNDPTIHVVQVIDSSSGMDDPASYARSQVTDGKAWGAMIFPVNFTERVEHRILPTAPTGTDPSVLPPASIIMMLDGSNTNIAQALSGSVQGIVAQELYREYGVTQPVQFQNDMVYGEGLGFIDTFAPGIIPLAVMMVTFMLSIISFIHERTTGTLARLLSTPITEGEIVTGYALAFGLVGLVQSIVVLATAILLFNIHIQGSVFLVLGIIFVLGIGMQGLGFMLSANARNEFQAIQFIPIVLFPSILLSGVFWPIQAVPEVLRPVSYFLPLTYAIDGARSVMIRGWGVDMIWLDLIILTAFALAMLTISVILMRRR